MDSKNETNVETTDVVESKNGKSKSAPTGRGSRQKRTDAFRLKKNIATDAAIQAGIFARLKIRDPTNIASIPIARDSHPVTVPITFQHLPAVVDRTWDTMQAIGPKPFAALDNPVNKSIFKKGMLILSEVKLCYAQRAHIDKPDEDLPSKKLYTTEELNDFNNMASQLPYPLAIYLESIGNTSDGRQIVTPLLAELQDNEMCSGALTFAPRQLVPLLRHLYNGVCENNVVHNIAQAINGLPGIEWEQFNGPAIPPNQSPVMVRITQASYNFWLEEEEDNPTLRWTDYEYQIFTKIVQSMSSRKGFNIAVDLSHGQGSQAQLVQTTKWRIDRSIEWFTMTDVTEFDQKLGAAFGFAVNTDDTQKSRFKGCYTTAYWRGEITPRRVLNAILAGQE